MNENAKAELSPGYNIFFKLQLTTNYFFSLHFNANLASRITFYDKMDEVISIQNQC